MYKDYLLFTHFKEGGDKMRKRTLEEIKKAKYVTITELAELCKVRYSTIKFYTELGIIPYEQKEKGLLRYYPSKEASQRVYDILRLRNKRKTIPEIIEYFRENKKEVKNAK